MAGLMLVAELKNLAIDQATSAYNSYVSVSSQFNTLRNKTSQGEIWNITARDSLVAAWKSADPRGAYEGGAGNGEGYYKTVFPKFSGGRAG